MALAHADIAFYMSSEQNSAFYSVRIDAKSQPYLNVENILTQWFGLDASCRVVDETCVAHLPPDNTTVRLDGKHHLLVEGKFRRTLPEGALVASDGKLWLRYDVWSEWLPIATHWDLTEFALTFQPRFVLARDLVRAHQREINSEKARRLRAAWLARQRPIETKRKLTVEGRYQIDVSPRFKGSQEVGGSYAANLDIFKGTLSLSGSARSTLASSDESPVFWHYTVSRPSFYQLQIGDTDTNRGLLLPFLSLTEAIQFNRLKPATGGGGGFDYIGHTMPGIEVDVYRNGLLLDTQMSTADGRFHVHAPTAIAGDVFTLKFYFKDGTRQERTLRVSDDNGLIIAHKNFNIGAVSGSLESGQWFTHLAYRYGLTPDLTGGIHALVLPIDGKERPAPMLDVAWRLNSYWDVLGEWMGYKGGQDYDVQTSVSYFSHHTVHAELKHFSQLSPIPDLFNQTPIPLISPLSQTAQNSWLIKDTADYFNWRLVSEYQNRTDANDLDFNLTGPIASHLSATFEGGHTRAKLSSINSGLYAIVMGDYQLPQQQLIEVARRWQTGQNDTELSYRYQGELTSRYDIAANLLVPDKGASLYSLSFSWRAHRHWLLSANANTTKITGTISYQDLVGIGDRYKTYDEFGSGNVEGVVMAPPMHQGGKPRPLAGVIVQVGSEVATTDQHGHYFVTAIQPRSRVLLKVLASSLPANLVPVHASVVILLRPSTTIAYNPQLSWAAGLDGQVQSTTPLPPEARVVATRPHSQQVAAKARIEPNGFFIMNGLSTGHYEVSIHDKNKVLSALRDVTIPDSSDWLSDVQLRVNP